MSLNKKLNKLFESKFKKVEEEEIEESNSIGAGEAYDTPKAFKTCSCGGAGECKCKSKEVKNESAFKSISKQMFLGEVNYKEYKTDESLSQRQKVNKSIKEESGIDESKYWESTKRNLLKIEGKMTRLAEKLRSF